MKVKNVSRSSALPNAASEVAIVKANNLQLHLALPVRRACPVCGTNFEIVAGARGRPQRFCGEACRRNEQRRQQIIWERRKAARTATERKFRCPD